MPKWTSDQQKVIDVRDNNILVSAAAGSGKTAVLVERIIGKIINDKVEADKLLVVTFTNAAAKEMKERIRKALDKAIEEDPLNEFLVRQSTLIASADISTIDSFCGKLVRDNFSDIDIDPSFRICDESEEKLLFQDAIDKVLEDNFEREDNDKFLKLIDLYTKTSDYSLINGIIRELYTRACSYPYPKEWLSKISKPYTVDDGTKLSDIEWIHEMYTEYMDMLKAVTTKLTHFSEEIEEHLVYDKKGSNKIQTNIKKGLEYIETLTESSDMDMLYDNLNKLNEVSKNKAKMSKGEKTFVKAIDFDDESKEALTLYREYESYCDSYNDIYEELNKNKVSDILSEIKYVSDYALTLISLTIQVMDEFDSIKTDKKVATFNDVEHFALNILIDSDTKKIRDTALSLSKNYDEVMIDEYQDINELQEWILKTLSNGKNMFMVGDVKQSIYGFRMARPDIFVGKCDLYNEDSEEGVLINLKKNFRSRCDVLDIVNNVFVSIMTKKTSGFDYDDNAKLYFGAEELYDDNTVHEPEIIVIDSDTEQYDTSREAEATVVAERIRELIDSHYKIKDKDENDNVISRDIRYSDIAIILRAANTNGRVYEEALLLHNIPCHTSSNKGYFDTVEVKRILSFLSVIDNPCNDIDLMAVLHSPIFNISNDMIAKVRLYNTNNSDRKNYYLYHEIKEYIKAIEEGTDDAFLSKDNESDKLIYAISMIDELRLLISDTPIHELLEIIYDKTSYLDYVSARLNGEYKRANLLALIDKAIEFEKTSYRGVFRFLRYIESMREYDLDTGEASLLSEGDDVVRILTMHKSKGLEFPVVFVSDLGSRMSDRDLNNSNIIHNSLGLGLEFRRELNGNRYKKDTQYKNYIKKVKKKDFMAEEARLLYVALTRAKEKLILTGTVKNPEETVSHYMDGSLDYYKMINSKSRLEWIVRGITSSSDYDIDSIIHYRTPEVSAVLDIKEHIYISDKKKAFYDITNDIPKDLIDEIDKRLSFKYPYEIDNNIKSKYSVSDIKHSAMEEAFSEEKDIRPDFLTEEKERSIPKFIKGDTPDNINYGAVYGTAMHRAMECYDFTSDSFDSSLDLQLKTMTDSELLTEEQYNMISKDKLKIFLSSDIARRMHISAVDDKLFLEQPFVLMESPGKLFDNVSDEHDNIIIQGIIDVFFEEDGEIVLLDYKTDKVSDEEELKKRYISQIDLYATAIEKSTHLKVKEKILYSFCLDKSVVL